MTALSNQRGYAHILVLLVILTSVGLVSSSLIPITRNYSDGKSNVKGVFLTEKKDGKKLEKTLEELKLKVASSEGKTVISRGIFGAVSSFPLKVATDSNTLVVTTPSGSKEVTVLPDQALKHMLASKVIDDIRSEVTTGTLASIPHLVKLEERDGILGYKVAGDRIHYLLGLIPLKTQVEAFVSAENGEVVETKQSLFGRFLNRIAP